MSKVYISSAREPSLAPGSRAFCPPPGCSTPSSQRSFLPERGFARPADLAACREMIRVGSRSFHSASLLLPGDVRAGAYALYGFCRLSDDVVDVEQGGVEAIGRLRARLDRVYAGRPADAVERALADTVLCFAIPRALLDALLEGLAWDAEGRVYETLSDVYAYAARVAGSVGAMMAALMGARTADLVARACDLGVAMQLTNIARDVGEDGRAGRLYLPRTWLREAGIDPDAWLADPSFGLGLARVVERLLRRADYLYERADAGITHLDAAFRPAIFAARHLYAEIGARVARRGFDSVSTRVSTPAWRKVALLAHALARARRAPVGSPVGAPLEETAFLVEAVANEALPFRVAAASRRRSFEEDIAWVVDLFAKLEERGART
jgi:15-cis-phytoene synthase